MRRAVLLTVVLLAWSAVAVAQPSLRAQYSPSPATVVLHWTAVPGANSYDVQSTTQFPNWTHRSFANGLFITLGGLAANTTYLYRIVPLDANQNPVGAPSNVTIVSTHTHPDDPLTIALSPEVEHMTSARTVAASIVAAAGGTAPSWTQNPLTAGTTLVWDEEILDLRNALNGALTTLGLPLPAYIDPALAAGLIRRIHLQQLRDLMRVYPEYVPVTSSLSEGYFSPNADGSKDTTTFTANVLFSSGHPRVDFRWRIDITNATTSALVHSFTGAGTAISYVWNGTNGGGGALPEGSYRFSLYDLDSLPIALTSAITQLDVTAPVATIATPSAAATVSNVRGSSSLTFTGSASDAIAIENWTLKRTGNSQSNVTINSGTTSVSSGTLGTLQTLPAGETPVLNGDYTAVLTVTDKAGNSATDDVPVTVGNFTASRSRKQANVAAGETVIYTSNVPFALTERLEIRRVDGGLVRTLVNNQQRAAGTYTDVWDGRDDQGQLVGDGTYSYSVTVSDATSTFDWNAVVFPPVNRTQFEYPKCWSGSAWKACSDTTVDFDFDPYAGKPLRIAYCVGGGDPDTGCTGSAPARVIVKLSSSDETTDACDAGCVSFDRQPSGLQELIWYGLSWFGNYIGDMPRLTVIRQFDQIAESWTVVHGSGLKITGLTIDPPMFGPAGVPMPVSGQTFTINVTRFANRPVTVTGQFRNMESNDILRTFTTATQNSDVVTLTWDGRADNGNRVAPGTYEVLLTLTDTGGAQATIRPMVVVRY